MENKQDFIHACAWTSQIKMCELQTRVIDSSQSQEKAPKPEVFVDFCASKN